MKLEDFPECVVLRGFKGRAVYTAKREGNFYLMNDERRATPSWHTVEYIK